ncbi:alpha/beta hydrolase [Herbiconiux daphne]|uniref:Alpha/beta hydrolase-fold protein n=1 Tax=Herbiconiux daphne TaxID=2970914 RepID=A0ABT2H7D1_9MICO|nr:alpha/beta hydrolase-fold protein [Herbiconiux daphne]MCS5735847.1 alpha/beta hydrolase-fold protein [Herbiconiux daphne]
MGDAILDLDIIHGPVVWIVFALAAAAFVYLLLRPPRIRWVLTALIGLLGGALVAFATIAIVEALDVFGVPLTVQTDAWVVATFAAIGLAVVNLWRSRWWRKLVAVLGILLFAASGTLGVNAYFGLNTTLASLFGIVVEKPIDINKPTTSPNSTADPDAAATPLYQSWSPPADMPATGKLGTQVIPATTSGFTSRPAGIYLPPAAQVPNAPDLPLVILMMGQPGSPDPQYIGTVLDEYAAKNKGLAPIVIVADQLGPDESLDPVCSDTAQLGNAETFITHDVVGWARANLRIMQDPAHWVIAGYSNGGGCAFKYGAKYPELWGNVLDVSGEEYPGSEEPDQVIANLFGGDAAAFEAQKPESILTSGQHSYPDTTAIFTVGENDPTFIPEAKGAADAATAAGWTTSLFVIPGAGHVVDALEGGFEKGFGVLYPRLGLSAPTG